MNGIAYAIMAILFAIVLIGWIVVRVQDNSATHNLGSAEGHRPRKYSKTGSEALIDAACILDARRNGRRRGEKIVVHVTRQQMTDFDTANHAREIDRIGADYGVSYIVEE